MKKKIIVISILIVVVMAGILYAITLRSSKSNDALLSSLEDNSKTQNLKEAKLTFAFEGKAPDNMREVLDQVENRCRNKLNIKLDFNMIPFDPENYMGQVEAALASGSQCDAFFYSNLFPTSLKTLADNNRIKDITEIFPQYAPKYYSKFSKEEIKAISVDNRIYAIPYHLPGSQMKGAIVREDLMKKYNMPDIKSYDDYEAYLKTIVKNEKDMVPMVCADTTINLFAEANGYVVLDSQLGLVYKWDDEKEKIMVWEQTPEFKKVVERINNWFEKGYLQNGMGSAQSMDRNNMIMSGKLASFISAIGTEININTQLANSNVGWRYKAYPLYPDKLSERNSPLNRAIVINKNSDNAERAAMFLEWLQSNQNNYDSLMYGIKGKTYNLVNDCIKVPDGVQLSDSCLNWPWQSAFQNIDHVRNVDSSSTEAISAYYKIIKEKTKFPPHMGFAPDYTAVNDIRNSRLTSFPLMEQELFSDTFKTGDIDAFIKEQKNSGIDMLVQQVQRQLDDWKAKND
ncbi:MAG TPA: extracellular solute-binding protein [Clostridia bacterium]|nr:extracellular solute-binding protein [Clostridia bacterium]